MRYKYMRIHQQVLQDMLKGNFQWQNVTVINPLPMDTTIISMGHDNLGRLNAVIESKEFPEISEGDLLMEYTIQFHRN